MNRSILLLLFFVALVASPIIDTRAEDIFESSKKALKVLEHNVTKITLPNGLRILLYKRGIAPVFAGAVTVGVGGVDETKGETGISHMFEHMAFKGTESIGTKDFGKEKVLLEQLEKLVAGGRDVRTLNGAERESWGKITRSLMEIWNNEQFSQEYERRGAEGLNASTDKEETKYYVSLPRTSFEFWCWIESERLLEPVMRQFYQEREVVLEERRMRFDNDPSGKLYENLIHAAFSVHPYRNPVIGYEDDIRHLTATKLESFRKRFYIPSNMVVTLVGDVDAERDRETIERYFGRLLPGIRPPKPTVVEPPQKEEKIFTLRADAAASFMVAYHKPHYPDPEDAKLTVLSEVLNGSSQSPLYVDLVKKGRVAAGVQHEEGPGVEYPNLLLFSVASKSPYGNKIVLHKFDETINRFLKDGASEDLLDMAKRSIAFDYLSQMKSNASLAATLGSAELQYGDWKSMIDWYQQAMDASMDDVKTVARKYLVPSNRTVGFLEAKSEGSR